MKVKERVARQDQQQMSKEEQRAAVLELLKKERAELEARISKSYEVQLNRRSVEVDFDAY